MSKPVLTQKRGVVHFDWTFFTVMKLVACQITMELICHWLPVFGRCFLKGNQGAYSNRQAEAATANFKTKLDLGNTGKPVSTLATTTAAGSPPHRADSARLFETY